MVGTMFVSLVLLTNPAAHGCGSGAAADSFAVTVRQIASSPDSVNDDRRSDYGMTRVPPSRVALVRNASICARAAAEYDKDGVLNPHKGAVAVVRAGPYWFVQPMSDFLPGVAFGGTIIFDSRWRRLAGYGRGS